MRRVLSALALSTFLVGATALSSVAVTSEPQPSAGAPATSAGPPSSATEQHEGSKHGSKQEAQERKAIKHTQLAITQGKAGNAQGLRKHAETALTIAEGAEKRHAEAHVEEGIKHLKLAVEEAQKGNAAEGTKHAEEALTHLKEK
ncbi:MAG: small metal-binding protein SmbP [Nitrospirota bacterium]